MSRPTSVAFVFCAVVAACADASPPPTAMAPITTGLLYEFGPRGMCLAGHDLACGGEGPLPLQFPRVTVQLEPFAIDVDEVTNAQYADCVDRGACTRPGLSDAVVPTQRHYYGSDKFADFAVVNVTWQQATAYCAFVGKRLPSEIEWERVASGAGGVRDVASDHMVLPGDCLQRVALAGCGGDQRIEAAGDSLFDVVSEGETKIFHLAANVAEWTDTWYRDDVTCRAPAPCQRMDQCQTLSDMASRLLCESETYACAACDAEPEDGACFYMCDGTVQQSIVCDAFTESVAAEDVLPVSGSSKVIRGAGVGSAPDDLCRLHSWSRDQHQKPEHYTAPDLGFRCARSL